MPNLTAIKSASDHAAVLAEIEKLIHSDPTPGSPEADHLELLTLIANAYEAQAFPRNVPDAVEAIKFRMEQQNLAPRDLVPYIGSRSKVSEILGRKRPLTLSMVRSLHERLHIPAKALIHQAELLEPENEEPNWTRFPLGQMRARGWIKGTVKSLQDFFAQLPSGTEADVLCRQSLHIRSARKMDAYALRAWTARIIIESKKLKIPTFKQGSVTADFMAKVAQLSVLPEGPRAARDLLVEQGIPLIIEPHLPHTYLDGAAILLIKDRPIIGMTLRHDRLDNFWFTLLHELAHVALHFDSDERQFIDDLDVEAKNDPKEREADEFAGETLIPTAMWKKSPASRLRSPEAAAHLAQQLGIHPSIVAGRMRHRWKAFRMLNHLVGHRQVRRQFLEVTWPE